MVIGAATTMFFREQTSCRDRTRFRSAWHRFWFDQRRVYPCGPVHGPQGDRRRGNRVNPICKDDRGTVGVAIMGAVLNGRLRQHFRPIVPHFSSSAHVLPERTSPVNTLQSLSIGHVNGDELFIACKKVEDGPFANRQSSFMQTAMDFWQTLMPSIPQEPDERNHVQPIFSIW